MAANASALQTDDTAKTGCSDDKRTLKGTDDVQAEEYDKNEMQAKAQTRGRRRRPREKVEGGTQQVLTDSQIRVLMNDAKRQYCAVKKGRVIGGRDELLQRVIEKIYSLYGSLEQEWSQSELSEEEGDKHKK